MKEVVSWGVLTKARATYYKPLWEGFAEAQRAPWTTTLIWPAEHECEHPDELTTPVHERVRVIGTTSRSVRKPGAFSNGSHYRGSFTALPSRRVTQVMDANGVRGMIIHELSPYTVTGLIWAKWQGLPVVLMTEVGRANAGMFHVSVRWWHALWGRWADAILAACPAAREPVCGRAMPVYEAFHAVDAGLFVPEKREGGNAGPVVFVFSGQFIARKGLDLWFQAAGRLRERVGDGFRLRLMGLGSEDWARAEAERAGVADLCDWRGYLTKEAMREAMASADVFVIPSRFDTYAVVVHEAACLGLPLLVSRYAGAAEVLVKEGENGHVVDPEDGEAFACRMQELMDGERRRRMSVASRALGEAMSAPVRGAALWRGLEERFFGG